jgi:hypothetical protein
LVKLNGFDVFFRARLKEVSAPSGLRDNPDELPALSVVKRKIFSPCGAANFPLSVEL